MLAAAKNFLKKYWQTLLLVAVIVLGYAWYKSKQQDWTNTIREINDSNQVVINQINEAREREAAQHAAQLRELQESIAKIQADYAKALADLEHEREGRKKEIVRKYGNDADGLAKLLANEFGFTVKTVPAQ